MYRRPNQNLHPQIHAILAFIKSMVKENGVEAFGVLYTEQIDLMFLDIQIPAINDMNFLRAQYLDSWGETDIFLAVSENLIDWEPVLKEEKTDRILAEYLGNGSTHSYKVQYGKSKYYFKTAVATRKGRFDSELVEPGPPALIDITN